MKFPARCLLTLTYAFSAVALGSTAHGDIDKVNGSIRLEEGDQAGDLSTVNGSVTVGPGGRAEDVETVNGSLRIEDRAVVDSADTVNGSVTLGEGAEVRRGIDTVNGSLTLRRGAKVGDGLENVNGAILVEGANVDGGIETVNGDIRLATGSHVTGGIHVEESRGWGGWGNKRNPKITIESGVVLTGPLKFEREVDLYVAPGVQIPEIEGVEPKRYTLE